MQTTYREFRKRLSDRERSELFVYSGRSWNIARARYIASRRNRQPVLVSVIDVLRSTNSMQTVRALWSGRYPHEVCDRAICYDAVRDVDLHRPLLFGVVGIDTPLGRIQSRVLLDGAHRLVRAVQDRRPFVTAHALDELLTHRCEVFNDEQAQAIGA